jgi:UDP-glucose 4-epimerase
MFTEEMDPKRTPGSGYARDAFEVEGYVRGFARRRPDVRVTTLRAANIIGPDVQSPITQYFRLPVVPTVIGFDPRLQFLHVDDLMAVLRHTVESDVSGTFNVAGDGVIMLSQALRRLGRSAVPTLPFAVGGIGTMLRRTGVVDFSPEQLAFLTYGRGVDTKRMRGELGFEPTFTTAGAFADFAGSLPPGVHSRERLGSPDTMLSGLASQLMRGAPGG